MNKNVRIHARKTTGGKTGHQQRKGCHLQSQTAPVAQPVSGHIWLYGKEKWDARGI
jgi:hypothetical protein